MATLKDAILKEIIPDEVIALTKDIVSIQLHRGRDGGRTVPPRLFRASGIPLGAAGGRPGTVSDDRATRRDGRRHEPDAERAHRHRSDSERLGARPLDADHRGRPLLWRR